MGDSRARWFLNVVGVLFLLAAADRSAEPDSVAIADTIRFAPS